MTLSIFETPEDRKYKEMGLKTPAGQARSARDADRKIFQFLEVIAETKANVVPMTEAWARDETEMPTESQGRIGREKQFRHRADRK